MKKLQAIINPGNILAAVLIIAMAVLPIAGMPRAWILYGLLFLIYLTMSNMWNLVAGYSGLISLTQPAFIGIAGYTLAMGSWVGIPWWGGMLAGALIAGVFAFIIAFGVFRLTGTYFAIATLVVPEALRIVFYNWRPISGTLIGGGAGYTVKGLESLSIQDIYWLAFIVALASVVIVRIILRSKLGLGLAAVRDNQRAAASAGLNTFRLKMYAFVIGAVFTGLAGAVFYMYQPFIEPNSTFSVKWTMIILMATVIGGLRTEGGPIVGSIVYVLLYFLLAGYGNFSLLIQGVILIVIMLLSPQGIVGLLRKTPLYDPISRFARRPLVNFKVGKEKE